MDNYNDLVSDVMSSYGLKNRSVMPLLHSLELATTGIDIESADSTNLGFTKPKTDLCPSEVDRISAEDYLMYTSEITEEETNPSFNMLAQSDSRAPLMSSDNFIYNRDMLAGDTNLDIEAEDGECPTFTKLEQASFSSRSQFTSSEDYVYSLDGENDIYRDLEEGVNLSSPSCCVLDESSCPRSPLVCSQDKMLISTETDHDGDDGDEGIIKGTSPRFTILKRESSSRSRFKPKLIFFDDYEYNKENVVHSGDSDLDTDLEDWEDKVGQDTTLSEDVEKPPIQTKRKLKARSDYVTQSPRIFKSRKTDSHTYSIRCSDRSFTVVDGASTRARPQLISSDNYVYCQHKRVMKTGETLWRCSVRNRTMYCKAQVRQCDNDFFLDDVHHICEPKPNALADARARASKHAHGGHIRY